MSQSHDSRPPRLTPHDRSQETPSGSAAETETSAPEPPGDTPGHSPTARDVLDVLTRMERHLEALARFVATQAPVGLPEPRPGALPTRRQYRLGADLIADAECGDLRFERHEGGGGTPAPHLTAQERAILRLLLSAPRRWFSIAAIADHLASQGLLTERGLDPRRSVMAAIGHLRVKLGDHDHTLIRLNRRVGYGIFPRADQP
jgi:hypothetical protein